MRLVQTVKNMLSAMRWGRKYSYDTLPPEIIRQAAQIPYVLSQLVQFSVDEYEQNPHYQHVIDTLAIHTVGPAPGVMGLDSQPRSNDMVEDAHLAWMRDNSIGRAYRELRKQAALTGIGIMVPVKLNDTTNPVGLGYKVYGGNYLKNPVDKKPTDRIINGIEYDETWQPIRFYLRDPDQDRLHSFKPTSQNTVDYTIDEVIYWSKGLKDGTLWPVPECMAAFTVYPYVRRFVLAALEAEEFKTSMPMAVELDSNVYSPTAEQKDNPPLGSFEYDRRFVPTLPPGMKLNGIPQGMSNVEKGRLLRVFAGTAALTVSMPANLALMDSSDSNMATAQVDVQPWSFKIGTDRFDIEPALRKSFKGWYSVGVLREGVLTAAIRRKYPQFYPHIYLYPDMFEHPDPNKRATARATDLSSGATTLHRLYSQLGRNPRREIEQEAQLLGVTYEEMTQIIISGRSAQSLSVVNEPEEVTTVDS